MKITLIAPGALPCKGYGGTERQVEWLAEELMRLGHEVVVIAGQINGPAPFELRQASGDTRIRQAIPADTQIVHFHGAYLDIERPTLNTMHTMAKALPATGATGVFSAPAMPAIMAGKPSFTTAFRWKPTGSHPARVIGCFFWQASPAPTRTSITPWISHASTTSISILRAARAGTY